ncbi:MAG: TCP-1/cpn60 chaperonin family protein [Nanoarchaeota archaeon]|nr:TCP-1/cpn60 chaperonin family protein [Nanoarchaeota archaeon]
MTEKQPMYILPENIQRIMGRDAQRNNILAARVVADTIKTTLGPKGMDKMLVSSMGDIIITNDGVTILSEMEIEHPAAKMLVEVAKTQEEAVGDGTTTAVILAGKLLENAEKLLDQKIHPTSIVRGYSLAAEKSHEILKKLAKKVSPKNDALLKSIAMTAMTGKSAESAKEAFANIMIKAVKQIMEQKDGKSHVDLNNIKLEKRKGGGVEDTRLIEGLILDKERVHPDMPSIVKDAKIAILDVALEIKGPETDTKISISSPEQLQAFLNREEKAIKDMIMKLKNSKATVVFCQKGIDDIAQYYLAKEKIYALRRVSKSDIEKLSKATGAKIISNLNEINEKDLGFSKIVEEVKQGNEGMTYVTGCSNPKALTILIRGGTEHVIDEFERAIKDGLGDIAATIQNESVVSGGGAIEIELARLLRKQLILQGREQLAVEQFADALESIPRILAENAGMDPIDIITELKSRHDKNEFDAGLNLFTGKIENTFKAGIIEPLKIKTQAIKSASEVSTMLLRIDDVIASGKAPAQAPQMQSMRDMGY